MRVSSAHVLFRLARALGFGGAALGLMAGFTACSTTGEAPRLALRGNDAEIAVNNLTPYPWRIALRSPQGAEVKTVQVQPRESFAVVVTGGDYVIEQALVAADPTVASTRNFNARFEPGERYRWSLATLLSSEAAESP